MIIISSQSNISTLNKARVLFVYLCIQIYICLNYIYVFKCSDINLNITVKCLQTGIPQRALDIMGCGGFLLSNYQEELLDVLVPDRDFVYYESFTDAFEKAKFYLEHEDLRKKIARSGYEQMKENYTFEDRFAFMASKCPFMK